MDDQDLETQLSGLQGTIGSISQAVAPSPLGSILRAGAAGAQGLPNPYLQEMQAYRDAQVKHQLELIRLRQSVMRQRQEKDQVALKIYQDLSQSSAPEARALGWQGILDIGRKSFNLQAPQDLAVRLSKQVITKDEIKSVMGDILSRQVPRETTMRNHPNLTLQDYVYVAQLAGSDEAKEAFGFSTSAKLLKEYTEAQAQVHEQQLKAMGIEGTSQEARDAQAYIREHFGVDPWFARTEQVAEARASAKARKDEHEAWSRHMAGERLALAHEALELARGRSSMAQDKLIIQPLQKQTSILKDVSILDQMVDRLPNLPKVGANLVGVKLKDWQRAWANPTDPQLVAFKTSLLSIMIGEVDRGTFDEKGTRFKEAFGPQIEILKSMPSAEALHAMFRTLQSIIQRKIIDTGQLAKQIPHLDPQFIPLIDSILNQVRSPVEEQLMQEAQ